MESGERFRPNNELLFLAVDGVALEEGIELFQLNTVFLELFIFGAEVAGWGFALCPSLRAFQDNLFAHRSIMPKGVVRVKAT